VNYKKRIQIVIALGTILNSYISRTLRNLISSLFSSEAEISYLDGLGFISVKDMQESQDSLYFL